MKIGFIGVGNMGGPICRNLTSLSGVSIVAYDVVEKNVSALRDVGVIMGSNVASSVRDADVIVTSLPTPSHVEAVILGERGVASNAKPGAVLIDLSTNSPRVSKAVAQGLRAVGIEMLEAPVTGGVKGAVERTLCIMVAGDESVFEAKRALFEAISTQAIFVGDIGAASVVKLVNNMLFVCGVALASEGLAVAGAAGVDLKKLRSVVQGGSGNSIGFRILAGRLPARDFAPSFALDLAYKDLRLVAELEEELGIPGLIASASLNLLRFARAQGLGSEDLISVIKVQEQIIGKVIA